MTELYAIKNLSRVFGRREVLSIDELTIEAGLIYGLLGPNGSGKTTLMKLLGFLEEPSGGEIFFRGRAAGPRNRAEFRSQVVWSPQFPVMFTGSLRYNVEYPMKIKGVAAGDRRRRAMELLDMVRLTDLAEAPARRLSGGEAQRASLARALAAGAEVLLLDEPTANVDVASRRELVGLVETLWREQNLSIIITTHDASLESDLCQKRIRLNDGHLVAVDDTQVHRAILERAGEGFRLHLPPEAGRVSGPVSVIGLTTAKPGAVLLKIETASRSTLSALVEDEQSLHIARGLSLNDALVV